jgi:hypothetical protein
MMDARPKSSTREATYSSEVRSIQWRSSMTMISGRARLALRLIWRRISKVRALIASGLRVSSGAAPSFTPSRWRRQDIDAAASIPSWPSAAATFARIASGMSVSRIPQLPRTRSSSGRYGMLVP